MEYKTPMIAEKMGISPKAVLRIVHQLDLDVKKNKFGHYVFDEEDVQTIMSYHEASHEQLAAAIEEQAMFQETSSHFEQKWDELEQRLSRMEERIYEKADKVVNYQLLQHRQEIEDLKQKVKALEHTVQQLQSQKFQPIPDEYAEAEEKPRRRRANFSIFGL